MGLYTSICIFKIDYQHPPSLPKLLQSLDYPAGMKTLLSCTIP